MHESGLKGVCRLAAILYPLTLLVAMTVLSGGSVVAEDGGGPTPPPTGDWNVTEDTILEGGEHNITGDIHVGTGVSLTLSNTTINITSSRPHEFSMWIGQGATLIVVNSTLYLDSFISLSSSSIVLSDGTVVRTRGLLHARSSSLFASDTTIINTAPNGGIDEDGEDAVLILNGAVNSEFRSVTIMNTAGDAGLTSPGFNGSSGGMSILISNVSTWTDCIIECRAGNSRNGGLGLTSASGGGGGQGADAVIRLRASLLEDVDVEVHAGDGGIGARGANNPAGKAGNGGNGGEGGNVLVQVLSVGALEMSNSSFEVLSGSGGSGGNGGEAIDGDGGSAGTPGDAGNATVRIHCSDNIVMKGVDLTSICGEGGYGGDHGRHGGGTGEQGVPTPGSAGGNALIEVLGDGSLEARDLEATSGGGPGLDGGSGYEQGGRGGKGGDAGICLRFNASIIADQVDLEAIGGNGGNGGPAIGDILGVGGDGGDAWIEFSGLEEMDVEHFSIYVMEGQGGGGWNPYTGGAPGIPTLDVETQLLWMRNGVLNMPLDDLSGDARGYLYNVTFDMEFGIHALPTGDAIVNETIPVTIRVVDSVDPADAQPHVGFTVSVFDIASGAMVDQAVTYSDGETHFDLAYFVYTSTSVDYKGAYYAVVSTEDKLRTKKVRIDIGESRYFTIAFPLHGPWIEIMVDRPVEGEEYILYPDENMYLETYGRILIDVDILSVGVQLYPSDGDPDDWPVHPLWIMGIPLERHSSEGKWGNLFPPSTDSNLWEFFFRFQMFGEEVLYDNGTWIYGVHLRTEFEEVNETVEFDLLLNPNVGRPRIMQSTSITGRIFNGTKVLIEGTAYDDYQLVSVEARIDGGEWEAVRGKEEWMYLMDTGALGEGIHTMDFRAFDGIQYSDIIFNSFDVRFEEQSTGNGDDGDDGHAWSTQTYYIVGGIVLFIVAIVLLVALVVVRSRSSPDGQGEG